VTCLVETNGLVCSIAATLGHAVAHIHISTCTLTHHSGHGLNTKRFTQISRLIRQQWVSQSLSLSADGAMHSQDSMLVRQK
jgi:hypothetical protein